MYVNVYSKFSNTFYKFYTFWIPVNSYKNDMIYMFCIMDISEGSLTRLQSVEAF